MATSRVTLSQLRNFLAAPPSRKAGVVQDIREQSRERYRPWKDSSRWSRDALLRDRRGSRDGSELLTAAQQSPIRGRASRVVAAQAWATLAPAWTGRQHARLSAVDVQLGALTVRVTQMNAELYPDGTPEALYAYFNVPVLSRDVVDGVMRVVQLAHPEAAVTFVDVRQLATYRLPKGPDMTLLDRRLSRAGDELATLLGSEDQAHAA